MTPTKAETETYRDRCPEDCPHRVDACEFETIRAKCTARVREKIEKAIPVPPIMFRGFNLNDRKQ